MKSTCAPIISITILLLVIGCETIDQQINLYCKNLIVSQEKILQYQYGWMDKWLAMYLKGDGVDTTLLQIEFNAMKTSMHKEFENAKIIKVPDSELCIQFSQAFLDYFRGWLEYIDEELPETIQHMTHHQYPMEKDKEIVISGFGYFFEDLEVEYYIIVLKLNEMKKKYKLDVQL